MLRKGKQKQRSQTIEDVEKLLLVWIKEQWLAGDSILEAFICEKAKLLHADLAKIQEANWHTQYGK